MAGTSSAPSGARGCGSAPPPAGGRLQRLRPGPGRAADLVFARSGPADQKCRGGGHGACGRGGPTAGRECGPCPGTDRARRIAISGWSECPYAALWQKEDSLAVEPVQFGDHSEELPGREVERDDMVPADAVEAPVWPEPESAGSGEVNGGVGCQHAH
jgi:hypothetical protein